MLKQLQTQYHTVKKLQTLMVFTVVTIIFVNLLLRATNKRKILTAVASTLVHYCLLGSGGIPVP